METNARTPGERPNPSVKTQVGFDSGSKTAKVKVDEKPSKVKGKPGLTVWAVPVTQHLTTENSRARIAAQDDKLETIGRIPFADNRRGKSIVFGQSKTRVVPEIRAMISIPAVTQSLDRNDLRAKGIQLRR